MKTFDKTCITCGAKFTARHTCARYCPACARKRKLAQTRKCRRASKGDYIFFDDKFVSSARRQQEERYAAKMAALIARDLEYIRAFCHPCGAPRVESPALRRIVEGRTVAMFCGRVAI